MTRNEFIKLLEEKIKPDAEMYFLVSDRLKDGRYILAFLEVDDVWMNADVDDPRNYNRGGVVFTIEEALSI